MGEVRRRLRSGLAASFGILHSPRSSIAPGMRPFAQYERTWRGVTPPFLGDFLYRYKLHQVISIALCGNLSTRKRKYIVGQTKPHFAKINFRLPFQRTTLPSYSCSFTAANYTIFRRIHAIAQPPFNLARRLSENAANRARETGPHINPTGLRYVAVA